MARSSRAAPGSPGVALEERAAGSLMQVVSLGGVAGEESRRRRVGGGDFLSEPFRRLGRRILEHVDVRVLVQVEAEDLAVILAEDQAVEPELFAAAVGKPAPRLLLL